MAPVAAAVEAAGEAGGLAGRRRQRIDAGDPDRGGADEVALRCLRFACDLADRDLDAGMPQFR
jgi:hypothetical protein